MEYINKRRKIKVVWTVMKGVSACREDFSRARVALFIKDAAHENRWLVPSDTNDRGDIEATIPDSLGLGVYSLELVWLKNGHYHESRCVSRAQADHVFTITDTTTMDNLRSDATVRIKSFTESYGYDGLSNYEIWCLAGKWSKSEEEFYERYYTKDETNEILSDLRAWAETEFADIREDLNEGLTLQKAYTDEKVDAEHTAMEQHVSSLKSYSDSTFATKTQLTIGLDTKADKAYVESNIASIQNQLSTKANKSDVYTKSETDTKLAMKANNTDVYTKWESERMFLQKEDAIDAYSKDESDRRYLLKADSIDAYSKDESDYLMELHEDKCLMMIAILQQRIEALEGMQNIYIESSINYDDAHPNANRKVPGGEIYLSVNGVRRTDVEFVYAFASPVAYASIDSQGIISWQPNESYGARTVPVVISCTFDGKMYVTSVFARQNGNQPYDGMKKFIYNGEVRDDDRVQAEHGSIITFKYTTSEYSTGDPDFVWYNYNEFIAGLQSKSYMINRSTSSSEYHNVNGTNVQIAKVNEFQGAFEVWKYEW